MQDISVSDRRMLEVSLALIFSLDSLGYSKYYWFFGVSFLRYIRMNRSKGPPVYEAISFDSVLLTAILDLIVQCTNSYAKRVRECHILPRADNTRFHNSFNQESWKSVTSDSVPWNSYLYGDPCRVPYR